MNYNYITRLVRMFVVLVLQILLFNHIHLFGYVTPLFMGYMIVPFNKGSERIEMLLWGFFTGLFFDMFCNTAGMGAGSMTLLAMVQPVILSPFTPRDAAADYTPGFKTMGFWNYTMYCFTGMLILHTVFFFLDAFTISNVLLTLSAIVIGTFATTFLCIIAELLTKNKN